MGEDDISAVAALLRAAEAVDGHPPLGEHKWIDLVQGGRAGFAGFAARTPGSSRLLGYAQLTRGHDSWAVEYVVHPSARAPEDGVAEDLLRAALDEVAREGGGHIHLWVPKPGQTADDVAHSVGLSRGRALYQMRRALPLEPDLSRLPRLAVRPFRVGDDEPAWLEVNNRAFHGHPEQGAWDRATLDEREKLPWFDPEDFLLHDDDGPLDAFCWTKVHDDEPSLGEIYVIGVDPAFQGRGLGKGILLAGLDHLAGLGLTVAMLYVDADDAGAVHLYRSVGFAVDHRDQAYVGDIPGAVA
ncbi:MAG: Mycothiol acetyltransferase [Acidimicrobiaceae bacterium]|nr:Mycothiol acetyltransferase [Acidimicrobiaceae bacterium]